MAGQELVKGYDIEGFGAPDCYTCRFCESVTKITDSNGAYRTSSIKCKKNEGVFLSPYHNCQRYRKRIVKILCPSCTHFVLLTDGADTLNYIDDSSLHCEKCHAGLMIACRDYKPMDGTAEEAD